MCDIYSKTSEKGNSKNSTLSPSKINIIYCKLQRAATNYEYLLKLPKYLNTTDTTSTDAKISFSIEDRYTLNHLNDFENLRNEKKMKNARKTGQLRKL